MIAVVLLGDDLADAVRFHDLRIFSVVVHGMAAEVHARDLVFHPQQLVTRELGHIGDFRLGAFLRALLPHIEKGQLSAEVVLRLVVEVVEDGLAHREHLTAVRPQSVQRAAFDQALQRTAVHVPAVEPLAEVIERLIRHIAALLDDPVDELPAEILDGEQPVADILSADREAEHAVVDVRRQDADAHCPALGGIDRELVLLAQHGREQRGHILPRIVAFEPCSAVRHHRVAGGV